MLRTLNMARICCPVGFSEKIIAFSKWKRSQIDTENNKKTQNFPFFNFFNAFFVKFSTDFVD